MHTLIFATTNTHKVAEVKEIAEAQLRILSLKDAGYSNLILEETAGTLRGNAQQKAQTLYDLTCEDCFAEDTGLEVDALHGAPGIYTARYAGAEGDPVKNVQKLLDEMSGVTVRTARFRTVIALIVQKAMYFFEGTVEGRIAEQPRGTGGFGYDPVFIPDGYDQTFAELVPEIKNNLSHRSQAVWKMIVFLKSDIYI
ncbi:MAG TPA: RdgB/HAM1 family non-canonical purine NTP pyrophosphatase [Saprospiraceae bacterium]|nr:RdgB/HAM1 family non-canonical purine NTP pyrophosphatase [Saprospiraceae bacterium]